MQSLEGRTPLGPENKNTQTDFFRWLYDGKPADGFAKGDLYGIGARNTWTTTQFYQKLVTIPDFTAAFPETNQGANLDLLDIISDCATFFHSMEELARFFEFLGGLVKDKWNIREIADSGVLVSLLESVSLHLNVTDLNSIMHQLRPFCHSSEGALNLFKELVEHAEYSDLVQSNLSPQNNLDPGTWRRVHGPDLKTLRDVANVVAEHTSEDARHLYIQAWLRREITSIRTYFNYYKVLWVSPEFHLYDLHRSLMYMNQGLHVLFQVKPDNIPGELRRRYFREVRSRLVSGHTSTDEFISPFKEFREAEALKVKFFERREALIRDFNLCTGGYQQSLDLDASLSVLGIRTKQDSSLFAKAKREFARHDFPWELQELNSIDQGEARTINVPLVDQHRINEYSISGDSRNKLRLLRTILDLPLDTEAYILFVALTAGIVNDLQDQIDILIKNRGATAPATRLALALKQYQNESEAVNLEDPPRQFSYRKVIELLSQFAEFPECRNSLQLNTLHCLFAEYFKDTSKHPMGFHILKSPNERSLFLGMNELLSELYAMVQEDEGWRDLSEVVKSFTKEMLTLPTLKDDLENYRECATSHLSGKHLAVTFTPTRGLLGSLAGFVCRTCASVNGADFLYNPNFVFVPFTVEKTSQMNPDNPEELDLGGGTILIQGKTTEGEDVLVIRGFNPTNELLRLVDGASLFDEFVRYAYELADLLGISKVLIPADKLSGYVVTNRYTCFPYIKSRYVGMTPVHLADSPNTTYNGKKISKICVLISRN